MSIYPTPDKLDAYESKYGLVILAAKRARQIKDNARKMIETRSANPLTVALEEIAEGAIVPRIVEDTSVAAYQASLEPHEPSLEDIIGAGPVLVLEPEPDSPAAHAAALRNAAPETMEDLVEDDGAQDEASAFPLDSPALIDDLDEEEEELESPIGEEEEE